MLSIIFILEFIGFMLALILYSANGLAFEEITIILLLFFGLYKTGMLYKFREHKQLIVHLETQICFLTDKLVQKGVLEEDFNYDELHKDDDDYDLLKPIKK
jgi:hypothetical protein